MNLKYILIFCFGFLTLTVSAQEKTAVSVAEKLLNINSSSATLTEWFRILEEQGVQLSYNAAKINGNEPITLPKQKSSVAEILRQLLYQYDFDVDFASDKKVLLQIRGEKLCRLYGRMQDYETGERLYGFVAMLKDVLGKSYFSLAGSDGSYSFKVPVGTYLLTVSCLGFQPFQQKVELKEHRCMHLQLTPSDSVFKEVIVIPSFQKGQTDRDTPAQLLSVNGLNPFAQTQSLPGVLGTLVSGDLHVNGGESDENQILLDGISLYHSRHNNSLLSQVNGNAVKSISYYDSFIPAQYEGRLSSVTDVKMKQGDFYVHRQHLAIEMPSASATFEGPISKGKASYLLSGRHSWLDFMENLFSDHSRVDRSFYDLSAKLSYNINPHTTLQGLAYTSRDAYKDSIDCHSRANVLKWDNSLYAISLHTTLGQRISNSNILSFATYRNEVYAPALGIELPLFIHEGMNRLNIKSEYRTSLDKYVNLSWGLSLSHEKFNLLAEKDTIQNEKQYVHQLATFANAQLRITDRLIGNAALNVVAYFPKGYTNHLSLQPRFTLRFFPAQKDILSFDFSRMGQFYHNVAFDDIPVPTDFRMPSVKGFEPRSAVHLEAGWLHREKHWQYKISSYYKRRYQVLGIRYIIRTELEEWNRFIMKGDAHSYGVKLHVLGEWERVLLNLSYTCARSQEWFAEYQHGKKHPSIYDVPHVFQFSSSLRLKSRFYLTLGGYIKSGSWLNVYNEDIFSTEFISGRVRRNPNYRLDMNISSTKNFEKSRLSLRYKIGIYNIVGHPKDYELIDLYSVETDKHCLPYFSVNLDF